MIKEGNESDCKKSRTVGQFLRGIERPVSPCSQAGSHPLRSKPCVWLWLAISLIQKTDRFSMVSRSF